MLDSLLFPFEELARNVVALGLVSVLSAYLGVYVVCKRVVFVGIALAELGALGIGAAFLLSGVAASWGIAHWEDSGPVLLSLLCTLLGALFFSLRSDSRRLSRESLLGVAYCLGAGLAVLCIWHSAEGLEKLKNLMTGDTLFVSSMQLQVLTVVAGLVLIVHGLFAKQLLFCSFDPEMARSLGIPARAFEVLLYLSIGAAVAVGLRVGGILLIFSLSVLPACCGLLLAESFGAAQRVSVAVALLACVGGTLASVYVGAGLPLPPSVVACLGGLFLLALASSRSARARAWLRRLVELGGVLACALIAVSVSNLLCATRLASDPSWLAAPEAAHELELLSELRVELAAAEPARRLTAVQGLAGWQDSSAVALLAGALDDSDEGVQRAALRALGQHPSVLAREALLRLAARQRGSPGAQLDLVDALLAQKCPEGLQLLIEQLGNTAAPPFFRFQALERLQQLSGQSFELDAHDAWQHWWERSRLRLEWDEAQGRFVSGKD